MKLSRAVQEFLSDGRTYLSPATLAAYESDLGRLAALVSPDGALGFTPDVIRAYFLGLSHQNRRMATLYRKHSALQEFRRWGVRKALWIRNPMEEIQRPPKLQHLPRPFTSEEMRRIMQLELPPIGRVIRAVGTGGHVTRRIMYPGSVPSFWGGAE
jgi:site-specific recombinase XerC